MQQQLISMIPAEANLYQIRVYDRGEKWDEPSEYRVRYADGTEHSGTIEYTSRYHLSANRIVGWAHVRKYTETDFDTDIKPMVFEDCDDIGVTVHPMTHGNPKQYDIMFLPFRVMWFAVDLPTDMEHILREPMLVQSFLAEAYREQHERVHEKVE